MREGEPHPEDESQIYTSGKSPDAKEPTLEKETPPEVQEQQNDKDIMWKEAEKNLEKYSGIEGGIKETIVGLNVFGVETVNSCEGHFNHGRIAPWVSIEKWESMPRERYAGQKEFEQQVYERLGVTELNKNYSECLKEHDEMAATFLPPGEVEFNELNESDRKRMAEMAEDIEKKYGITPEITKKWMDAGMQAEKEVEQAGKDGRLQETEEYKQWKAENDAMKDRVQELLDEFYKGRKVAKNTRIIIDQDGTGSWCIHNGGKDYYDVTRRQDKISDSDRKHYQKILDGKNPKKEQGDIERHVEKYRAEFQEFAEFLKRKYFDQESVDAKFESPEQLKKSVIEKAEQLGVPILTEKDIDERLGDKPYATHTIVSNQENAMKVLDAGKLQSAKALGGGSMTWEGDKLIGMDENVFFALGKGYMRRDTYSLIFDPEVLAQMSEASFVEDDLAKFEGEFITEFLEKNSKAVVESIKQNRVPLKESFETMVKRGFEGGHGIYGKYFGENAQEVVQDFLDAVESKGFKGIADEEEVIDQFTILSNAILSERVMPPELRDKLKKILEEKVIKPHTITGAKNIHGAIGQCWKADEKSYKEFLPDDKHVPDKVVEIRVPNEADIKKAIIGIYVPTT